MTLPKNILLGITGGIAAYKCPDIVRRLRERGAEVRVVMTAAAREFITPMTLQTVSGYPVADNLFDLEFESAMGHIELARWADRIVIAPASADCMARLTYGHANDLLTTLCLASQADIFLAPAMNPQMWQAAITQHNIQTLSQRGYTLLIPAVGETACGEVGPGRMQEPEDIVLALLGTPALLGQRVLITAGPTREAIDSVRYISNESSGKMGYALAQAARLAGAEVTLISGQTAQTCHARIHRIDVVTASEMHAAALAQAPQHDIFIAAAAVADYRVQDPAATKIKKQTETMTLQLCKNPDILATIAQQFPSIFSVGFAAETENILENAQSKLQHKHVDMMIANRVGWDGANAVGFNSDHHAVTVLSRHHDTPLAFPMTAKINLAKQLIDVIAQHRSIRQQKEKQHAQRSRNTTSTIENS